MGIVDFFGKVVGKHYKAHPAFTRWFMRLGYAGQALLLKYRPDERFSPSQQYLARICMQYTRMPMKKPRSSALINLFTPSEILHAMDIYPQCAEAFSSYLTGGKSEKGFLEAAEQSGVPETFCSYHRALLGALQTGILKAPRFAVTTSLACDANTSTFRQISQTGDIPLFYIDVPNGQDEHAVVYVQEQLEKMTEFVEDVMHHKLKQERLLQAVRNTNESMRYYSMFRDELAQRDYPSSVTLEMFRVFASHILLGSCEAAQYYKMQYEDVMRCTKKGGKRILWSHVLPYYMPPLKDAFDFNDDMVLLLSDMNFDAPYELDEQNPYRGMAQRLVKNHFNGGFERKVESFLAMADKLRIDGAVLFCHWGCKQSNGGVYMMKDALMKKEIPTLVLDGDACDSRNPGAGQMATRVQAFMEMMGVRK